MRGSSFRASNTQQGLTENMQILTGQKGDRLDKALTLREAAELGMVNLRRNGSGQIVPEIPPGNSGDPEWSGVQQPVAPTGVTADGAFHTITLTWDTPAYKGHSYAEILRAEVDNPSKAVSIGTTLANVYSDAVGKGFSAFYWVRFVNKNGMVGPYHSAIGLHAETSKDIQDIINELDGKIKISHFDQWLKQDYEGVKETAASLENGVGSMWAVKASASQINAGIGLVAKSDGTSQVFIAASQVFVYDPNNPNNSTAPLFAIDQGKAVIQEAMIRSATIQIIHSEKITADYIKAGVSISAPLITGGQIDMGNAFMAGGAAGFGKGGPYGGWGLGWNTIIYTDGSLYTNRIYAEGGHVRNMTIGNCTIEQDCVVKGTVYAGSIVGDLYRKKEFTLPAKGLTGPFNPWVEVPILSAQISASPFQQRIILENIASSFRSAGTGTNVTGYLRARLNGVVYDIASKNMGSDTSIFRLAGPFSATVPANAIGTLDIFITASQTFYFNRNEVLFGALECFKAESSVLVVNVA